MPVDYQNHSYLYYYPLWDRIDDVVRGEDAVKDKGEIYLPRISEKQKDERYKIYKQNTYFLEATGKTVDRLLGLIFRRLPSWSLPPGLEIMRQDATLSGVPLDDLSVTVSEEVLKKGRYGILIEYSEDQQRPFFVGFRAEEIINWRWEYIKGVRTVCLVVLREFEEIPGEDGWEIIRSTVYRVLKLSPVGSGDWVYSQSVWKQGPTGKKDPYGKPILEWQEGPVRTPSIRGQSLSQIPFVFFGSRDLLPDIDPPPMLPLVNANLAHYRRSAEWSHLLREAALPMRYVTGYVSNPDDGPIEAGASMMLEYPDPGSKVGVVEVSASGAGPIERDLVRLEKSMADLGAELLEVEKRSAETAEAQRLRQSGKSASLLTISRVTSRGFGEALKHAALFSRQSTESIAVQINTDFFDQALSPDEIKELVASWQAGAITRRTLLWNLQRGEILEPEAKDLDAYERDLDASSRTPSS